MIHQWDIVVVLPAELPIFDTEAYSATLGGNVQLVALYAYPEYNNRENSVMVSGPNGSLECACW